MKTTWTLVTLRAIARRFPDMTMEELSEWPDDVTLYLHQIRKGYGR